MAYPGHQLVGFFAGAVGDPEYLHLVQVDSGPEDFADVAAAGAGDAQARVGAAGVHVEDHGVDEFVGHFAAYQVHHCVQGFAIRFVLHPVDEGVHVAAIQHRFGAKIEKSLGLVLLTQCVGNGTDNPAELDQGRAHTATRAGNQHPLARLHVGRGEHVVGGLVGAHAHGRQLGIGQIRIRDVVKLVRRQGDIFGVTAIGAMAVVVRGEINVGTVVGVDVEVQQAALPETLFADALTDGDYSASDVGAWLRG